MNKGNVAHHIAVLEDVGLVRRVGTRTGRGGTGVLDESVGVPLHFSGPEATSGMMQQLVTRGLIEDAQAFVFLRRVHLTNAQAHLLAEHRERIVWQVPDTDDAPASGVFVSVLRA
ncbi:MAG: hypothetical protein V9G19_01360 [Tetrasphaera sp.]